MRRSYCVKDGSSDMPPGVESTEDVLDVLKKRRGALEKTMLEKTKKRRDKKQKKRASAAAAAAAADAAAPTSVQNTWTISLNPCGLLPGNLEIKFNQVPSPPPTQAHTPIPPNEPTPLPANICKETPDREPTFSEAPAEPHFFSLLNNQSQPLPTGSSTAPLSGILCGEGLEHKSHRQDEDHMVNGDNEPDENAPPTDVLPTRDSIKPTQDAQPPHDSAESPAEKKKKPKPRTWASDMRKKQQKRSRPAKKDSKTPRPVENQSNKQPSVAADLHRKVQLAKSRSQNAELNATFPASSLPIPPKSILKGGDTAAQSEVSQGEETLGAKHSGRFFSRKFSPFPLFSNKLSKQAFRELSGSEDGAPPPPETKARAKKRIGKASSQGSRKCPKTRADQRSNIPKGAHHRLAPLGTLRPLALQKDKRKRSKSAERREKIPTGNAGVSAKPSTPGPGLQMKPSRSIEKRGRGDLNGPANFSNAKVGVQMKPSRSVEKRDKMHRVVSDLPTKFSSVGLGDQMKLSQPVETREGVHAGAFHVPIKFSIAEPGVRMKSSRSAEKREKVHTVAFNLPDNFSDAELGNQMESSRPIETGEMVHTERSDVNPDWYPVELSGMKKEPSDSYFRIRDRHGGDSTRQAPEMATNPNLVPNTTVENCKASVLNPESDCNGIEVQAGSFLPCGSPLDFFGRNKFKTEEAPKPDFDESLEYFRQQVLAKSHDLPVGNDKQLQAGGFLPCGSPLDFFAQNKFDVENTPEVECGDLPKDFGREVLAEAAELPIDQQFYIVTKQRKRPKKDSFWQRSFGSFNGGATEQSLTSYFGKLAIKGSAQQNKSKVFETRSKRGFDPRDQRIIVRTPKNKYSGDDSCTLPTVSTLGSPSLQFR